MVRKNFSEFSYKKISEMDDAEDIHFWQNKTDLEKFTESWRLVVQAVKLQGKDTNELRLQRSIGYLQRQTS